MSTAFSMPSKSLSAKKSTDPRFLKTRMCSFNLQGKCTRGEACKFAHAEEEMAPVPDLHCTRICKVLLMTGTCPLGDSCTFAHNRYDLRPTRTEGSDGTEEKTKKPARMPLNKVEMCKFFMQGQCLQGESCTFAHDEKELQPRPNLFRTSRCFAFLKGKCRAGDACKYSHTMDDSREEVACSDLADDSRGEVACSELASSEDDFFPTSDASDDLKGACPGFALSQDDLFCRQTTIGTNFSSPSQDFTDELWSRQTSIADFDDEMQSVFGRQCSLGINENTDASLATQELDNKNTGFSRQTSWADLDDDDDDDFQCPWSRQTTGQWDLQTTSLSSLPEADECDSQSSFNNTEDTSARSLEQELDSLSKEEEEEDECSRLRSISKLNDLKINVKNSFLAFEDIKRDMICGTAARRVRSA